MNITKLAFKIWKNRKNFPKLLDEGKDVIENFKDFKSKDSEKGKNLSATEVQTLMKEFTEVLEVLTKLVGIFK